MVTPNHDNYFQSNIIRNIMSHYHDRTLIQSCQFWQLQHYFFYVNAITETDEITLKKKQKLDGI